jgi:hypothetical protein
MIVPAGMFAKRGERDVSAGLRIQAAAFFHQEPLVKIAHKRWSVES